MEDDQTPRLSARELGEFFRQMFPDGFAGADVVREIAPEEWSNSPLFACFHPSPEQVLTEQLRRHRMWREFRPRGRKRILEKTEDPVRPEPTIVDVLADWEDPPVNIAEEVTTLVGECLWDVFSDNHNVVAADGRAVDIGSFRGASAFLDEHLTGSNEQRDCGDEYRFYLGTIWISGRADLTPVYHMIFRRLKLLGADWEYVFPQLHFADLSSLRQALEKSDEPYSQSEAFAQDQEERQQQAELEKARADLEKANSDARHEAMDEPPPPTVRAYQEVFGLDPKGWPPC